MRIQLPSAIVRRHRLHRTEIYHVKRTAGAHIWSLTTHDCAEAIISACQNPSEQVVTDLGGREVDHSSDEAVFQELLHGLSARASSMKYQAVEAGAEQSYHLLNTRGGHAEHGESQGRAL